MTGVCRVSSKAGNQSGWQASAWIIAPVVATYSLNTSASPQLPQKRSAQGVGGWNFVGTR